MSTTAPPTRGGRPAAGRRRGGAADLVRSLAVLAVVLVGVVVFVQAEDKPSATVQAVDYTVPVTVLRGAAPWPVLAPATPPPGWTANHVRTHVATASDPTSMLDLGFYVKSAHAYAAVEQSDAPGWLTTQLGTAARRTGTTDVGGVAWQTWTSSAGQTALVRAVGASTLVVDGKSASDAVIRRLAASLTAG